MRRRRLLAATGGLIAIAFGAIAAIGGSIGLARYAVLVFATGVLSCVVGVIWMRFARAGVVPDWYRKHWVWSVPVVLGSVVYPVFLATEWITTGDRVARSNLRGHLFNLAGAQAAFFAEHQSFASDLTQLDSSLYRSNEMIDLILSVDSLELVVSAADMQWSPQYRCELRLRVADSARSPTVECP